MCPLNAQSHVTSYRSGVMQLLLLSRCYLPFCNLSHTSNMPLTNRMCACVCACMSLSLSLCVCGWGGASERERERVREGREREERDTQGALTCMSFVVATSARTRRWWRWRRHRRRRRQPIQSTSDVGCRPHVGAHVDALAKGDDLAFVEESTQSALGGFH